jgi:hypothetical protein
MPQKQTDTQNDKSRGQMTVEEAGRMGGHKGGQRVKQLIEEGKRAERDESGEELEATQMDDTEDDEEEDEA